MIDKEQACNKYQKIEKQAYNKFLKTKEQAWDEYEKTKKQALDEYEKIKNEENRKMKYTNDNVILEECPMCKGILTSWSENQYGSWVCDVCGFGKSSINEHKTLQKIIRHREIYFNNEFSSMKDFEENYNQRSKK